MTERLHITLPEDLQRRLRLAAGRRHVSESAWASWAVEQALRGEPNEEDPLARLMALGAPTGDIDTMNAEIASGRAS